MGRPYELFSYKSSGSIFCKKALDRKPGNLVSSEIMVRYIGKIIYHFLFKNKQKAGRKGKITKDKQDNI